MHHIMLTWLKIFFPPPQKKKYLKKKNIIGSTLGTHHKKQAAFIPMNSRGDADVNLEVMESCNFFLLFLTLWHVLT